MNLRPEPGSWMPIQLVREVFLVEGDCCAANVSPMGWPPFWFSCLSSKAMIASQSFEAMNFVFPAPSNRPHGPRLSGRRAVPVAVIRL